tara:strand:- start:439 stop:1023 length:585 start_codon:yes stop_codon:yes gene_type:complete
MAKLVGFKKTRTAIFISGAGSNFKNLINFSKKKNSPIKIILVLSNNPKAKGLKYVSGNRIKKKIFKFINKRNKENHILKYLKKNKIDLICLAGFMKILSKNFIKKFNGLILNIHPSLLPKYKGLNTHEKAIRNKDKYSGCSVHLVNSKLDSGKIIMQKKVRILKTDNPKTLAKRVLKAEHILYPKAIGKILINL